MALIGKMRVSTVEQLGGFGDQGQTGEKVKLSCVYDANPESPNFKWSEATPSGNLEWTITNKDAFGALKPGVEYMVTITKARD